MTWIVIQILFLANLLPQNLWAEVKPPNYNFKLDELSQFYPGSELAPIKKQFSNLKLLFDDGTVQQYKAVIVQKRYVIPIHFHTYKGKVLDFHAKLPSYFLHDVFHQSIINRFGKQQEYKLKNGTAFYKWKQPKNTMLYSSTCTITCFPIYFTVYKNAYPEKELTKYLPYFFRSQTQGSFKN